MCIKLIFLIILPLLFTCFADNPLLSKFLVGQVEVWTLLDGSGTKPYKSFFPDQTLSDWEGLTDVYGKPYINPDGIFISNTSYSGILIRSQGQVILVDDGLGIVYPVAVSDQKIRIPDLIEMAGFNISQIDFLVHTHLHRDHTGWDVNFGESKNVVLEFPNTQVLTYQKEWEYWTSSPENMNASAYKEVLQYVKQSNQLELMPDGDYPLTDEVVIKFCPGHTPGHACIEINSDGMVGLISGDAIHHPAQIQMWEWRDVFDWDEAIATGTRQEIILRCAREKILLFAHHFTHPSVGHVIPYHGAPVDQSGFIFVPF